MGFAKKKAKEAKRGLNHRVDMEEKGGFKAMCWLVKRWMLQDGDS